MFIVGHLRGRGGRQVFPIGGTGQTAGDEGVIQQFSDGTGLAYALDASYHKGIGPSSVGSGRRTHVVKQIMEADYDRDNPSAYRVYDADGLAPTIDTAQGGGRQPHIIARAVALQNSNMQGRRIKDDGDPTFTISATDRHGVMLANHRIRRLTPRECWRLQGFPDWAFDKAQQAGTSDIQLYRQAGNSVTVPVVEAIARRLT